MTFRRKLERKDGERLREKEKEREDRDVFIMPKCSQVQMHQYTYKI